MRRKTLTPLPDQTQHYVMSDLGQRATKFLDIPNMCFKCPTIKSKWLKRIEVQTKQRSVAV